MAFKLTKDQQRVVDERNQNILVSAAAGSGKTAVLVERIESIVCDKDNPVDIDRFLVVTFTRAAAAEMKERLFKRLSDKKQAALVGNADITTIDSFCSRVLRDHFSEAGIDPDYKIADEVTLKLMEKEELDKLIKDLFEKNDKSFLALCDTFVKRESLHPIYEMVDAIYQSSLSFPWPNEWISSIPKAYSVYSKEELIASVWYRELLDYSYKSLLAIVEGYNYLISFCESKLDMLTESHPYTQFFSDERDRIKDIVEDRDSFLDKLSYFSFDRITSKKLSGEDVDARARAKGIRDSLKKEIENIYASVIFNHEEFFKENRLMEPVISCLCDVTLEYTNRLWEVKRETNTYSFSDIEHLCLKVLKDPKTGERTSAAKTLSENYAHVFVDEYQDSNLLQEEILSSIVKDEPPYNYFMVGDVKQSIYRFRKARSDLFTGKYYSYKDGVDGCLALDLSMNFRSRKIVTDFVNDTFVSLMKKDVGGVDYDESAHLVCGAAYGEDTFDLAPELLITLKDDEIYEGKPLDADELEAVMIAQRIRALVSEGRFNYSDIVILHRSGNAIADTYSRVLLEYGIPVFSAGASGYFKSFEIETLVAALKVLNNPNDDISLASFLINVFDFTEEELAIAGAGEKDIPRFADRFFKFADSDSAGKKYKDFKAAIDELLEFCVDKPVCEIIQRILSTNDFYSKIKLLKNGKLRVKNIEKLIGMSIAYEKTGPKGLFDFVEYISDIKKYDMDFGMPNTSGLNMVRIMTIHKSKGLEFPVCILAGCGKKFKGSDAKGGLAISDTLGVGFDFVDRKHSFKITTPLKETIKLFEKKEQAGENQRLLYVALTRAKEKLIVTSVLTDDEYKKLADNPNLITTGDRIGASTFIKMLYGVFSNNPQKYRLNHISGSTLVENTVKNVIEDEIIRDGRSHDEKEDDFVYPVSAALKLKSKYSVSEIKKMNELSLEDGEEVSSLFSNQSDFVRRIPSFIEDKPDENLAARRGTAMHRFMECLDFTEGVDIKEELARIVKAGLLSEEDAKIIDLNQVKTFTDGELFKRMCIANKNGKLYREKTFVMGIKSSELFTDTEFLPAEENDTTLVQGIIDAYFCEDDEYIIIDYKTDKVNNESDLKDRYSLQLDMYERALGNASGMSVSQRLLYSFVLGKSVCV